MCCVYWLIQQRAVASAQETAIKNNILKIANLRNLHNAILYTWTGARINLENSNISIKNKIAIIKLKIHLIFIAVINSLAAHITAQPGAIVEWCWQFPPIVELNGKFVGKTGSCQIAICIQIGGGILYRIKKKMTKIKLPNPEKQWLLVPLSMANTQRHLRASAHEVHVLGQQLNYSIGHLDWMWSNVHNKGRRNPWNH